MVKCFMLSFQELRTGQRLREVHPTLFGQLPKEWIVQEIFRGTDGIQYARIARAADQSEAKTLSVGVLTDRRRFAIVQGT